MSQRCTHRHQVKASSGAPFRGDREGTPLLYTQTPLARLASRRDGACPVLARRPVLARCPDQLNLTPMGVTHVKRGSKWQASYRHGDKLLYLGRYDTPEEAAMAYDRTVIELKGDKAILNFLREEYENL